MTRSNIATAINAAHDRVEASKRAAVEAATECGRLLIEAKATVSHGGWGGWLREHCQFSARTAQLYMEVARYLADGDAAKAQRVADLSLREVARIVGRSNERKPTTRLSAEDEAALDDMLFHWASGKPEWRAEMARRLYSMGEVSADQRDRMIATTRNDRAATDSAEAAQYVFRMMRDHLPEDAMRRAMGLADRHKLTFGQLAKAFDAVTAERRSA